MTVKPVKPAKPRTVVPDEPVVHRLPATRRARMAEMAVRMAPRATRGQAFALPKPFPGVLPKDAPRIAMDFDDDLISNMRFAAQNAGLGEGLGFLGYTVLAELAQRPEFRRFSEVIADEMTRKFVRITSSSDESQQLRIKLINDAFDRFDLKGVFRKIAEVDGLYGRANLCPVFKSPMSDDELKAPLIISKETVPLHSLKGFKVIEPFWTYPTGYDTRDPTSDHFYRPRGWYVMGKEYHATRMMPFVGREVPDILKPAYAFGGLSLTQMVKPYVDNWIRTRQNVADAIENFAQNVLKTNLEATLTGGAGDDLEERIALYNAIRSSRGLMVLDQASEDFATVAMPLSGLPELQSKAQEMMCSIGAIPLVKYLGIQPSGLNADSDGVIRTFYDGLSGQQPRLFGPHMKFVIDLIMQSELGEVNDDISHSYEALWQMSEVERAQFHKTNAETAKTYIDAQVLDPAEERERLATEEDGLYQGLDPDDLPEPPPQPGVDPETGMPLPPGGVDPNDDDPEGGDGGGQPPPFGGPKAPPSTKPPAVATDALVGFDEWEEHKHPRGEGGKFASGPGGAKKSEGLKASLTSHAEPHKAKNVGELVKAMLLNGHGHAAVLDAVKEKFPEAKTNKDNVNWYKNDLAKEHKFHAQVDLAHALEGEHKLAALAALKVGAKGGKAHAYLDALIEEHGAAGPKEKPSGSPTAAKWAAEGEKTGKVSTFKAEGVPADPSKMTPEQWNALPTVYCGVAKGHDPAGHQFVTTSKSGAEFHAKNGGTLHEFKVLPGAKLYPDIEGGVGPTGYETLFQPKKQGYGGSSGIVKVEDLAPLSAAPKAVEAKAPDLAAIKADPDKVLIAQHFKWLTDGGTSANVQDTLASVNKWNKNVFEGFTPAQVLEVAGGDDDELKLHLPAAGIKKSAAEDYAHWIDQGYSHGEALANLTTSQKEAVKGLSAHELHKLAGTPGSEAPAEAEPEETLDLGPFVDDPTATKPDLLTKAHSAWIANWDEGMSPSGALSVLPEDQQKLLKQWADQKHGGDLSKAVQAPLAKGEDLPKAPPATLDGLKKVGPQLGSNPGGVYEDEDGDRFYVKHSKSDDHAKNEVLAGKLYQLAGAPVVAPSLVDVGGGKLGTITAWIEHEGKFEPGNAEHAKEVGGHFATHAWTGNWDAIGLEHDNQVKMKGKFHTADVGGALKYRAQGAAKKDEDFSDMVKELDTMADPKTGNAGKVFGEMSSADRKASAAGLANVSDEKIDQAVTSVYGYGGAALTAKLVARKNDILKKLGAQAPAPAPLPPVVPPSFGPAPSAAGSVVTPAEHLAAFKQELSPDHFIAPSTKKMVENLHKKAEKALKSNDPAASLAELKAKVHTKFGKVHKVLGKLIAAQGKPAQQSGAAPPNMAQVAAAQAYAKIKDQGPGLSHTYVMNSLPPLTKSALAEMEPDEIGKLAASVPVVPKPAPAAAKPSSVKISQKTKDSKDAVYANLDKVGEKFKPAIQSKLSEIEKALGQPDPTAALKNIEPIPTPSGQGQKGANLYLTHLKIDHGIQGVVKNPTKDTAPIHVLSKKQKEHYEAAKAAPPIVHDRVHHATDAQGKPLKAVLKASSADVPGDWYAAATAALEGDHTHGDFAKGYGSSHVVKNLDGLMDSYTDAVSYGPLSGEHKTTLKGYQDSKCYAMNDAMNGSPPSPPPSPNSALGQEIAKIKEAINASAIPTHLPVWRGVGASFESVTGFKNPKDAVGKGFVHKSFASVSRSFDTSKGFSHGKTLLKFTVPAGTKGQFMTGQAGGEREIILDSHSIFRIDKVETGVHGVKHLVHCTYLGRREDAP